MAIKYVDKIFKTDYEAKQVLREIQIMRMLSEYKDNSYTVKLFDVIISDDLSYMFLVMEHMQMDL